MGLEGLQLSQFWSQFWISPPLEIWILFVYEYINATVEHAWQFGFIIISSVSKLSGQKWAVTSHLQVFSLKEI